MGERLSWVISLAIMASGAALLIWGSSDAIFDLGLIAISIGVLTPPTFYAAQFLGLINGKEKRP